MCQDCASLAIGSLGSSFSQIAGSVSFVQPDYQIFECAVCGLLFRSPTLSDEQLDTYYSALPENHWNYLSFTPPERLIGEQLEQLPAKSKVLDFGCSSGRLLAPWVDTLDCYGFEINDKAAAIAASKGLSMLTHSDLESKTNEFDMIILVDVFEHLRNPLELLRKLWKLIKPEGVLIISTGCGDHWACRIDPAQFWYFRNLEHLCMITKNAAAYIAADLGGKVTIERNSSHYDLPLWVKMRLHAAHAAYWIVKRSPAFLRSIWSAIPVFGKVASWNNSPTFACSDDHLILGIKKTNGFIHSTL
jgi:2-polyprenyl-3-methyl-5-hydroxy-6-metoxy-1,4-benzoquinol methylase